MAFSSTRRTFLALGAANMATGRASAQAWPARPVRLVVPSAAGAGVTDIMARIVGQKLSENLGQQVVVDNRPGASGILGADIVAKASADGYTLLIANV
jgi:tripartite-type tricarboxylate transporter receptor subunit TctC